MLDRGWPHSLVCGSLLPIAPVERCGLLQRVRCYSPAASRSRTFSHYSGLLVRVCAPTGLCHVVARARPCWGRWSLRSLQLCETLFLTSPPIISYSPPPPPTRDGRTQHSGSEPCGDGKAAQQARPAPRGAPHVWREWTRSVRYVDRLAGASCSYNIHKPRNERSSLALGLATRLAAHDWGLSRSVHTDNHTYPVSLHPPSGEATSVWVGSATYWNGWQEVLWQSRVQMNGSPSLQVHLEAMHAHSSPAWQTLDAFVELQKSVSSGGQLHPSHAPLSSRPGAAKVE